MKSSISVKNDNSSISLDEFIEIIEENKFDLADDDDIATLSVQLNKLNNNKTFLINQIAHELTNLLAFQESNVYDYDTFILHRSKNFLIRAVVWQPLDMSTNNIFEVFHDNNFDLLTIGYFGPGYKTHVYTYNNDDVVGLIDEKVNVQDKGIFTLTTGRILLYDAKKDIHIQIPPESLSVSLNVIPLKNAFNRPQFEFDRNDFRICRYLHKSSNELTIRLAGVLGNQNDIEVLKTIFDKHSNPHLRAYAASSISQISNELTNEVYEWVNGSNNKVVIDIFRKEKEKYGFFI
jgi:hypothetical protein